MVATRAQFIMKIIELTFEGMSNNSETWEQTLEMVGLGWHIHMIHCMDAPGNILYGVSSILVLIYLVESEVSAN